MRYSLLGIHAALMAPRRSKPCPPLAGEQFKTYAEYEKRMNQIRRDSEEDAPLEGQDFCYALEYLSHHEEWLDHISDHGEVEAIFIEWNPDVPPYRERCDQNQFWVHYEDGEKEVFSYKLSRSSFGMNTSEPEAVFQRDLRRIKIAARCIIRPLHEELKASSGLTGSLDVHHDKDSFESLLFRFLKDELKIDSLNDVNVVDTDNIGGKSFFPQDIAVAWYDFHEANATLVVMTKEQHRQWHSINGKDKSSDWSVFYHG